MSKVLTRLVAAIALLTLMGGPTAAANGTSVGAGLWPANYTAVGQACGSFSGPNLNGFCYIDDSGSVELGVKFTSSKAVDVVGVRLYRTDAGSVKGASSVS
jgi:hypothetical protein